MYIFDIQYDIYIGRLSINNWRGNRVCERVGVIFLVFGVVEKEEIIWRLVIMINGRFDVDICISLIIIVQFFNMFIIFIN